MSELCLHRAYLAIKLFFSDGHQNISNISLPEKVNLNRFIYNNSHN